MHISVWQKKATEAIEARRGKKPPVHHLLKLVEEVGELAEAENKGFDDVTIGHEAADVLFSLVVYCESRGIDLDAARAAKFKILRKRWER